MEHKRYLPIVLVAVLFVAIFGSGGVSTSDRGASVLTWGPEENHKPIDLVIALPWRGNFSVPIDSLYGPGGGSQWHDGEDYYSLDFGLPENTRIYPIAPGRVIFAEETLGDDYCNYGWVVVIEHGEYQSIYAHLLSPSGGGFLPDLGDIDINTPLGVVGGSGCSGDTSWPTHLHFTLKRGGMIDDRYDQDGNRHLGPDGGTAIIPEPFIGTEVYEGFGLTWPGRGDGWHGPVVADDIREDDVPGPPTGRWSPTLGISDDFQIEYGQVVSLDIVDLPSDVKEVRITAWYNIDPDGSGPRNAGWSQMDDVTDRQVWRILARCWPRGDDPGYGCIWHDGNSKLWVIWENWYARSKSGVPKSVTTG